MSHRKTDRMLELAAQWRLPVVFFTEGGGGRPGDTDSTWASGLDDPTFRSFGRLSGLVPLVGVDLRPLLRRQRGAAGLLRRGHRHRERPTSAWAARR